MCKRKQDVMDKVMEITLADCDDHLQLVQRSLQGRTDHEHVEQQSLIKMECMCLEQTRRDARRAGA